MKLRFIFLNKFTYIRITNLKLINITFYINDIFIFIIIEILINVIKLILKHLLK